MWRKIKGLFYISKRVCCIIFPDIFRIIYLKDYTLKTLRIKPDKWSKLCNSDEVKNTLVDFVATGNRQELVISQNVGGQLQVEESKILYFNIKYIMFNLFCPY